MTYSRINITPSALPMLTLLTSIRNVEQNGLDISPDYQRGYIWSDEYKDQLIISIILNYPIGNIVINNLDHPNDRNAKQELVDGKQRLTTIIKFVDGANVDSGVIGSDDTWYKLSAKASREAKEIIGSIIGDPENPELKKMNKVKRLTFRDLPQSIKDNIIAYSVPVYTMQAADPAQIRDYFKVLQNQEKLRAGEIINALPDNVLYPLFRQVDANFLTKINMQGLKRAEFEKIYYSVVGVWFDDMQINTEDRKVIEFVEKLDSLSEERIEAVRRLNENLNYIAGMPTAATKYRMSKRTLKHILGLAIYQEDFFKDDTLSKVDYICQTSAKCSAFNSSESENVSLAKYFGDEFECDKEAFKRERAPLYRVLFTGTARSTTKIGFRSMLDTLLKLYAEHESDAKS